MFSGGVRRPAGGRSKTYLRNSRNQNEATRRQSDLMQAVQRERKRRLRGKAFKGKDIYSRVATILICPSILLLSSGSVFTLASWWPAFGDGTIFHKMPHRTVFNIVGPILLCIGMISGVIVYIFYHKINMAENGQDRRGKKAKVGTKRKCCQAGKASRNEDRNRGSKDRKSLEASRESDTTCLLSSPWLQGDQNRKPFTGSQPSSVPASPSPRKLMSRDQSSQTTFSCFDSKFDHGFQHQAGENDLTQKLFQREDIQYRRRDSQHSPASSAWGEEDKTSAKRPPSYQLSLIEQPFENESEVRIPPQVIRKMLDR